MAALDTAFRKVSATVMKALGRSGTLRRVSAQASYNTSTGTATQTTADTTVRAVVTTYAHHKMDGEQIKRGDLNVVIAAASLASAPTTADKWVMDSAEYAIVRVDREGGDLPVLYSLQVRR